MDRKIFVVPFFPSHSHPFIDVSEIEKQAIGINDMIQEINSCLFKSLDEIKKRDELRQSLNGMCNQLKYPSIYR